MPYPLPKLALPDNGNSRPRKALLLEIAVVELAKLWAKLAKLHDSRMHLFLL